MKRIIICGAGEVGRYAAEVLAHEGHHVTVVDLRAEKLEALEEVVDIQSLKGSSCHAKTLIEAGIETCDLLMAATNHDEFNILSSLLAKRLGAKTVVARIHNRSYLDDCRMNYKTEFGIEHLICPEQLTSLAITGALDDPGANAIERFAQNKIEMHRYSIQNGSEAIGVALRQLKLPVGLRLALVERGGESFAPFGDTRLQADDVVTLIGANENFKGVKHMFHGRKGRNADVAVMGGTSMTEWLAEDLLRRNFSVRIFEANRPKAIELAERYPEMTVIQADPTDPHEFAEEHLEQCGAFIAATDDDEHNILGALQAKQLGAPLTSAVIQLPTYLSLLEHLGIDLPFSPRIVAAKELLNLVDDSPVKKVATLAAGVAEVFEIGPIGSGAAVDRPLKEITLPKGAFIAAVQRGEKVKVPGANDSVVKGDILIFIGPPNIEKQLSKLFIES